MLRANVTEHQGGAKVAEYTGPAEAIKSGAMKVQRQPGDLQVRAQLKKMAVTDKSRVDEMFLRGQPARLVQAPAAAD